MRSLFDVNMLLALVDGDHVHHQRAREWFGAHRTAGWASCALTENGMVRIVSQSAYPGSVPPSMAIESLAQTCRVSDHEYWPCDVTIRDSVTVDRSKVFGPKQLTDIYLLALAVAHDGRFVTFDKNIALSAAPGAGPENLVVL